MKRKPLVASQFLKKELEINRGKNIFSSEFADSILSVRITEKLLKELKEIDLNFKHQLLNDIVENVIRELCLVNQYYHFGGKEKRDLRFIYAALLDKLVENEEKMQQELNTIKESHLLNLREWLKNTNPFAEELYAAEKSILENTPCAEYSAEFQIMLFGLDISMIRQPILDIGCGEEHNLIRHLRQYNVRVYGIDRYKTAAPGIAESDWLTHDFGVEKWGTIISNMSFSNHFHHHHLRSDGKYEEYARCYLRILQSLQKGGAFYYAPHLPFIENLLDPSLYRVAQREPQDNQLNATKVERL